MIVLLELQQLHNNCGFLLPTQLQGLEGVLFIIERPTMIML